MNKKILSTFLKGFAMGSVDIVPGISGGTMALILKIYSKIIKEIKSIDIVFLKNILQFKFKKAFSLIDAPFLISLFIGIITAIIALARIIDWLLTNHPVYLYSFFFGLIIISAFLLIPKRNISIKSITLLIVGFFIAAAISFLSPANTPETYLFIFLSGALAICAMILPGISGAFVLLLLGKYEFMISVLKNPSSLENIIIIIIFIFGCLVGLLSFSRFLNQLLKKHYHLTLMVLIGFMLGALNKIWPFKKIILDSQGLIAQERNIIPSLSVELIYALALCLAGILIGYLLGKIKSKP